MIKVLVCDDSLTYRSKIRAALETIPWIEISAVASSGKLALERMKAAPVDLLTLDLEMPDMDGLETLREIKRLGLKCKVIVFASSSKRAAESTIEALRLGAIDFVTKPDGTETGDPTARIRAVLEPKISILFPQEHSTPVRLATPSPTFQKGMWDIFQPKLLVIGSSTGGPTALESLFSKLKGPYKIPVVLVQHMPPVFTAALAERLGRIAGIPAYEVQDGMKLESGSLYVAPGDYHVRLNGTMDSVTLNLDKGPQINSVRPAVDPMFATAADIFRNHVLGVVLTGMGADGRDGAIALKAKKGTVLIQDQQSSVVWGMPGAVHAAGAFDQVLSLDEIANQLSPKLLVSHFHIAGGQK